MHIDLEIKWKVTYRCNFRCPYCFCRNKWDIFPDELKDIDTIVEGFDRLGRTCQVFFSGGEPFLFPNFIELCKRLTQRHFISINTNISHKDVKRFAEEIDPRRVRFLNCAVHLEERLRKNILEDFIQTYNLLQNKGFIVFASYVVYPNLVKRLESDYAFFKSRGIILRTKVYRGKYLPFPILNHLLLWRVKWFKKYFMRRYPGAFSPKDKAIIRKCIDEGLRDRDTSSFPDVEKEGGRFLYPSLDKHHLDGVPSFKGYECQAGREVVTMDSLGEVHCCYDGKDRHMGNLFKDGIKLFDKPIICSYNSCSCPNLGFRYSKLKQ